MKRNPEVKATDAPNRIDEIEACGWKVSATCAKGEGGGGLDNWTRIGDQTLGLG